MIVVTGGTGRVGGQVVAQLRERDLPVRVLSRNPARSPAGTQAARADLADPASLEPHLRDAEALFLVWPFTSAELTASLAPRVALAAVWGDPGFAASALDTWERFVTHPETVTSTVRDVTGAPAHAFADWAAAHAGAFR